MLRWAFPVLCFLQRLALQDAARARVSEDAEALLKRSATEQTLVRRLDSAMQRKRSPAPAPAGPTPATAANVVMTPSGIAIAADGVSNELNLARLGPDGSTISWKSEASRYAFADLSIDPASNLVFALSTTDTALCSFAFSSETTEGEVPLNIVNCVRGSHLEPRVRPLGGVGAFGETLVVSGGGAGVTVYNYDADGKIASRPSIRNQLISGAMSHPDVVMVDANTFALSTESSQFESRFGTQIVSLDDRRRSASSGLRYNVENTLGTLETVAPANFPLVNAIYKDGDSTFMYTANGPMQIQNLADANVKSLEPPVDAFLALTVAVNQAEKKVTFGGILEEEAGGTGWVLVYDLTRDPANPELVHLTGNDRIPGFSGQRVTSVASGGDTVAIVNQEGLSDPAGAKIHLIPFGEFPPLRDFLNLGR